jgi:Flp pilus assembly protein TadG
VTHRFDEAGMVTAETAVVLPALVVVLALLVGGVHALGAQLACQDAARVAARAAARGEPTAEVARLARAVAPQGARVSVAGEAGLVRVGVTATVRLPGPVLSRLPAFVVVGRAVAADETSGRLTGDVLAPP